MVASDEGVRVGRLDTCTPVRPGKTSKEPTCFLLKQEVKVSRLNASAADIAKVFQSAHALSDANV
jgi:hypothetical protein